MNDVQYAIIEHIYKKLDGREWPTNIGDLCNVIKNELKCYDAKLDNILIPNALKLLVEEDKITIRKYISHSGSQYSIMDYKTGQDFDKFIFVGDFRIILKPKAYNELTEKQFRNLGSYAANKAVRDTINQISSILTLDATSREFAIRILEELVRIGVRNYQDYTYLSKPAQAYLKNHPEKGRQDCEVGFYQPFLRTELQRDELLAGKITGGVPIAGGTTDIFTTCQIPIEAKVIYPDDKSEESVLMNKGVAQDTQYASLTRLAFLSVLDLRPRNTIADLSNIQNDVKVISIPQKDGEHNVLVVRVQHICGYGAPSEVRR